jgi:hypothetical protein
MKPGSIPPYIVYAARDRNVTRQQDQLTPRAGRITLYSARQLTPEATNARPAPAGGANRHTSRGRIAREMDS